MLPRPEPACFVIADISGYTGFLAGVELEHAQDIIADVMDTMVRRLRPPFRLAKFEGDAAFFYACGDKGRWLGAAGCGGGRVYARSASGCATSARRRRARATRARRMKDLDLKFVCHHGEFIKQKMSGPRRTRRPRRDPGASPAQEQCQ